MCLKREYRCYKGKDNEDCCQRRVDEAVGRRTVVMGLVISLVLLILALTVKTASAEVFADQVSFAGTVTSIVLSVIAIWMSITGERNTNEIKEKVRDSTDRLTDTTNNSRALSEELKETLDNQNTKYDEIISKVESVINNIDGMKDSVSSISDLLCEMGNTSGQSSKHLGEQSLEAIVIGTIMSFQGESADDMKKLVKKGMLYMYDKRQNKCRVPVSEMIAYLSMKENDVDAWFITGIIYTFSKYGVFEKVDRAKIEML